MASCGLIPLYRQREFHQSPLWRILVDHAEPFLQTYDSRFADSHGPLPRAAERVIDRLVRCGDPRYGLSLLHCADCQLHMAVPTFAKRGLALPVSTAAPRCWPSRWPRSCPKSTTATW